MENSSPSEEEMLLTFQKFMLGGGKDNPPNSNLDSDDSSCRVEEKSNAYDRRKPNKKANEKTANRILLESPNTKFRSHSLKIQRENWRLFHNFCRTVERKWIHTDNQVTNVVSSIENIQGRVPLEMKLLSKLSNQGYGDKPVPFLSKEDVHLALSHDLLQHEKMVAALRKLLLELSDSLQMIGRQLNDAVHHFQTASHFLTYESAGNINVLEEEAILKSMRLMDDMNEVFLMISRESYRKQCLSITLFDSVNNTILSYADVGAKPNEGTRKRLKVPQEWSRQSKQSCINVSRFDEIFKKSKLNLG